MKNRTKINIGILVQLYFIVKGTFFIMSYFIILLPKISQLKLF